MNCREIKQNLDAGFTSSGFDLSTDIAGHLESCADCRAYYQELLEMAEALQPLESIELTEAESTAMIAGLEKAAARTVRKKSVYEWAAMILRPALAAVLLMIIGLSTGPNLPETLVITEALQNVQFTQTDADDILPYLIDDDSDILPEMVDQDAAAYITGQVSSYQADDILEGISSEEAQWLIENFTLEI